MEIAVSDLFQGSEGSAGFKRRLEAISAQEILIFSDKRQETSYELAKICRPVRYEKGQVIYQANSDAEYLYFLFSGRCGLSSSNTLMFSVVKGQSFGEWPLLFGDFKYAVRAVALEACDIGIIPYSNFVSIADLNPSVWRSLARKIAVRLDNNNRKHQPELFLHNLVFVVHGIRTFARWGDGLGKLFRKNGVAFSSANYGYFGLYEFLAINEAFRNKAVNTVESQLKQVVGNHPGKSISTIAHSFGSYLICEVLHRNPEIDVDKIIFCGSVVKVDHPYLKKFKTDGGIRIINDLGSKDKWPKWAGKLKSIYGDAGTHGFRLGDFLKDRVFKDFGHSTFFEDEKFCETYWLPFIKDGEIVDPP
jgi:hypothetical protein